MRFEFRSLLISYWSMLPWAHSYLFNCILNMLKYWLVEINHSHTKSLSVESLFQKIWNSCITRIRSYIRGSKRSGIIYLIQLMPPSPWDCIPLVCCYSIFYLTPILWFDSVKLVFLIRFFLRLFVILFFVDSKFHGDVRGQLV